LQIARPRVNPAWFFLIPAITLVAIFYVVPFILSIYISFTPLKNWNLHTYLHEITTYNYVRLFHMIR